MAVSNTSAEVQYNMVNTGRPLATFIFETPEFETLKSISAEVENPNNVFLSQYQYDFDERYTQRVEAGFEDRYFFIGRRTVDSKTEYFSISDNDPNENVISEVSGESSDGGIQISEIIIQFNYDDGEQLAMDFGGPIIDPVLDFTSSVPASSYFVNSITNEELTYDSLTTIGGITQENLTITIAGSSSDIVTIEAQQETFIDTGGISTSGEVTRTAFDSAGTETTTTATIVGGY